MYTPTKVNSFFIKNCGTVSNYGLFLIMRKELWSKGEPKKRIFMISARFHGSVGKILKIITKPIFHTFENLLKQVTFDKSPI